LSVATDPNGDATLIDVPVRRIPMTQLRYLNANGANAFVSQNPWFLTNRRAIQPAGGSQTALDPKQVYNWSLIEIRNSGHGGQQPGELQHFVDVFQKQMANYGMVNTKILCHNAGWNSHKLVDDVHVGDGVRRILKGMMNQPSKLLFVVIILPRRDLDLYARVKRIAELELGCTVVCCVPKRGKLPSDTTQNSQYNIRANMISKINLKSASTAAGHAWSQTPALLQGETMVVGMDVVSGIRAQPSDRRVCVC